MIPTERCPRGPYLLDRLDRACELAIAALERERCSGYAESTHRMRFAGFGPEPLAYEGRVFQTALIGCALLLAAEKGFACNRAGIESDIAELGEMRCRDVRGGWRYFPQFAELPPDADDLAQVAQLLLVAKSPRFEELCGDAMDLLLERVQPDGSLQTWIIDPKDASPLSRKLADLVERVWGNSVDLEVVANVMHALSLRGDQRAREFAGRMASFLIAKQDSAGTWATTWYCGPYYGLFACARAMAEYFPASPALGRAARYLGTTQNGDGGWGEPTSNATDTALALSAAAVLLNSHDVPGEAAVKRGVEHLIGQQRETGLWPASPFIRADPLRAQPQRAGQTWFTYQSEAMTTALCLQSLCAARRMIEQPVNLDLTPAAGIKSKLIRDL